MNPVLEQIKFMKKIVGFGNLSRMRKRHSLGLKFVRGYVATHCMWTLMNTGLLDELQDKGCVDVAAFAQSGGLDRDVLEAVCEYLDGIKVLNFEDGRCRLEPRGAALLQEPRGLFDLLYGYEPVLRNLEEMIRSEKTYGDGVARRSEAVARGSGELGRQLPFLAVRELVYSHGFSRILELGCGDLGFLFLLCEKADIICFGIDHDAATVAYARNRLKAGDYEGRIEVEPGDMFEVEMLASKYSDVDAIVAIDVFHEYLSEGTEKIAGLLKKLKLHFPDAHLVVAEFFKIPRAWLRRIPTSTLEHHLLHSLTNQEILPVAEWVRVFEGAGYEIVEKKLLHAIGHGYFVLK